jgi:hypothetical protein
MTITAVDPIKAQRPSARFAKMDPTESLAEGIGSSYPVIGYKGKIFSIRWHGEKKTLLRPDDGSPVSYLDVVILRQAKVKSKSYYAEGFAEGGSEGKRPTCASLNGITPDTDVLSKQSDVCAICPRNEWKTDQNGKKSRECSDYKRLAVLILPNQTVPLYGQPLMEPAFLRIPPASLNALVIFGDNMSQQGWPYMSFITRIMFDPQKSHPEFVFKFVQGLSDVEADTVLGLREDVVASRITGEDEIARRALPAPAATVAVTQVGSFPAPQPPASAPTPAATVAAPQPAPAPVIEALANPGLAAPAGTAIPTRVIPTMIELTQTQPGGAFGSAAAPPPPADQPMPQPGAMVGQSAEDVGTAAEDPDLDAQIAAMLQVASA